MADEKPTSNSVQWIRWAVGIGLVFAAQVGAVVFYIGGVNSDIEANEKRIVKLEAESVTQKELLQLSGDLKEVRADVKLLLMQKR